MKHDYLRTKVHKALYEADNQDQRDQRKLCLAKIYLNRHKSFLDEVWVDLYKDWLVLGGEELALSDLRTYAVFNYRNSEGQRNCSEGYATKKQWISEEFKSYRKQKAGVYSC